MGFLIIIFVFLCRPHRKKCCFRTRKQQMETERKTKFNIHKRQLMLLFLQTNLPLMLCVCNIINRRKQKKNKYFSKLKKITPVCITPTPPLSRTQKPLVFFVRTVVSMKTDKNLIKCIFSFFLLISHIIIVHTSIKKKQRHNICSYIYI